MINKNMLTHLLQTVTLVTFLAGIPMAEGARAIRKLEPNQTPVYANTIHTNKQAEDLIATMQAYIKKLNFSINLKDLQVYGLGLNPIEAEAIKHLKGMMAQMKPYELTYAEVLIRRHFHTKNYDVNGENLVVAWDGNSNSYIDEVQKIYRMTKKFNAYLKKLDTLLGYQALWSEYILFAGHEEEIFPEYICTLSEAKSFLTKTLNYLKVFNFETNINLEKNPITDTLSPAQRAEKTQEQILRDVVNRFSDYGRKYSRLICWYFLNTIGYTWNDKRQLIKWDGKTNSRIGDVKGNFAGSDVRDFLLPKLQKYFGESNLPEEQLQGLSEVCNKVGCE